ncbi:MAG: glycosyl hydrolase family 18 protein, partial [Spirochaetota bacterium]
SAVPVQPGIRKHLVVAELSNSARTRTVLKKKYPARKKLIRAIAARSSGYDGVQIDFEAVPAASRAYFLSFLSDVKKAIGPKILSVAVPARNHYVRDAYDYAAVSAIADRVIIMAYDEHWNTSSPGPIASYTWCETIVRYAASCIPPEKLVMGIPLYGRSWFCRGSRELSYAESVAMMQEHGISENTDTEGYPSFSCEQPYRIDAFYENSRTISEKAALYGKYGARNLAFWRLGQEPEDIWENFISATQPENPGTHKGENPVK